MHLLPHYSSSLAVLMYFLFIYVIGTGVWKYIADKWGGTAHPFIRKSTLPLGICSVALGFLGFFKSFVDSMEAISYADNISPEILAGSYADAGKFAILGFLTLAVAGLFRYVNQK